MRILAPLSLIALTALLALLPAERTTAKTTDWHKKLTRNDPDEVFKTIEQIAKRRDISAAPALLEVGAETPHAYLAVACGEALAQMKAEDVKKLLKDKDWKKTYKKALGTKDAEEQRNLARVLGTWSHGSVDGDLAKLASGGRSPEVQQEALYMCGSLRITKNAPFKKVQAAVGKALKGRTGEIRAAACSAIGRLGGKEHIERLTKLVRSSKEDYDGLYAVWALKHLGYDGGIKSFAHVATGNAKRETKQACLKAITELSTLKDIDELLNLSKHNKKDVRDAAILALGRMPWRAWRKKKVGDRERVERGEITPHTEGEKKKQPDEGLPDAGLNVPDRVIDRLIQVVLTDRDWEVRDAARQGLLRFGKAAQPKVQAAFPQHVTHADFDTATTVMELCGLFKCEEAHKDLIKVALHDKDYIKRMFAARALEGVKPQEAVKALTEGIKTRKKAKDYELRGIRALGYIRHMDAFHALVKYAGEDGYSEEFMREVEFALERLTGHRFGRKPDRWAAWLAKAENPLYPRVKEFNRQENRRDATEKRLFGLTPSTERAVESGLRWLEAQQHPMGLWDGNEKGFGGVINCEPAYTGLSLLAFLGAGYNSAEGKYRETIRRASEFLAATQFYDGGFPVTGGGDDSWIFAYLIGMGIWGITESFGLSGDEILAEPAQWGIDYLVRVQTPGKGWRYGPRY